MKVALLYSGNFRTFNECAINHLNFFDQLFDQIDVYFSTWDKLNYTPWLNDPIHFFVKDRIPNESIITEDIIKGYIPEKWTIKFIEIDSYDQVDFSNYTEKEKQLLYQYYKIDKCFKLVPKTNDYDLLIRIRPDITLNNQPSKDFINEIKNTNSILFNSNVWYDYPHKNNDINEMIWLCDYNMMEKTSKIFDNFDNIKNMLGDNIYGEAVCYYNLILENIKDNIRLF